jgi:putative transposase
LSATGLGARWLLPSASALGADTVYDSFLLERGTTPVIPNNPTPERFHAFDGHGYRARNLIERICFAA